MPYYKYTALFAMSTVPLGGVGQVRVGGWSESWYENAYSASLRSLFDTLCEARARLLPSTASIIGQRYQQVQPVGSAQTGNKVFTGNSAYLTDSPQQALLCRAAGQTTGNIRPLILRCIPDQFISGGELAPDPTYWSALQAYFDHLGSVWRFRGRELNAEQVQILNVEADGDVFTEDATTFSVGDMVQVLSTKSVITGRLVGGTFQVQTVTSPTQFKLRNWALGDTTGGRVRRRNYVFPLVLKGGINVGRIIQRKVGRPSNQFRGRKSRKRV